MSLFSSLRARLLTTYLGLILFGLGGLTLFAGRQISQSIYTDFINNQHVQTLLLASTFGASFGESAEYGIPQAQMATFLQSAAERTDAHIALLDLNGIVQADSRDALVGLDLSQAPEILEAKSGESGEDIRAGESSDGHRATMVNTAAMLNGEDEPIGYVHLATTDAKPKADARRQWMILGGSFLLFSLAGTLLSLWLLSTLIKPLGRLRQTALRMAEGDLDQRVSALGQDEIGEVGHAFNEMAAQVQAMVTEQQAFASNASHELRTPLTTVRLRVEALQEGDLDEEKSRQYVDEIEQEVDRMSGLVDDLILLSRLDAHRMDVGQEEVQVERVLQSVANSIAGAANQKQITLAVEQPPSRLPTVTATTGHIQVVLRNLLDNAIKYTPTNGSISAQTSLVANQVRVHVQDNGQGIAPDELPRLTERFYRADKARTRNIEGVGLGLTLVNSIVDLYGGEIQIESRGLGMGTTVTVSLPMSRIDRE